MTGSVSTLRKPVVRYAILAAALIGLVVAAYFIYTNRPISVQTVSVEQDVPVRVFGLGTVEARVRSDVGFEVGATLMELQADHGDRVKKGDVLAQLNLGEQKAKLTKAKAALLSTNANIKKADANLERAQVIFTQKQEANRRTKVLAQRNVVSTETAEEAQREEDVARVDVLVARSETEVAKALLSDAHAQLQFEETLLRHRTLVAPYDAIIIERQKELGTVVKAGDPIFTLVEDGGYWGLAYIDESQAGHIREGQKVEARLRSRPQDAFTGRVTRIGLESDRVTEERRVFIEGDNPPSQIYLGEQVEFWITVAQLDQAVLVPEAAVQSYDGIQGRVWTVESGRLQRRVVKFRHRTEDARLEIVDGLPEGASVVTRLEDRFREGRLVRVVEEGSK